MIRTADADASLTFPHDALAFSVAEPSTIYLLWDRHGTPGGVAGASKSVPRIGVLPAWVKNDFVDTGLNVGTSDGPMGVLVSARPHSGVVRLGGCSTLPHPFGAAHNYVVVAVPAGDAMAWAYTPERSGEEGAGEGSESVDFSGGQTPGLRVVWEDAGGQSVRVALSPGVVFPAGPATVIIHGEHGGRSVFEYSTAREVVKDFAGPAGWLVTLPCCGRSFPKKAQSARPGGDAVERAAADGSWIEVPAPQKWCKKMLQEIVP